VSEKTPVSCQDDPVARSVAGLLKAQHRDAARAPLLLPDEAGAFPDCFGFRLLGGVPPVGLDANTLRGDILRACRTGRTTLITAANAGAVRLFGASHVIEEVWEHAPRWTRETEIPLSSFHERWQREYLPLIREVRDGDIPISVLSIEEQCRIALLAERDSDDVPSAVLALALGAFFMSEDPRALEAVYGPTVDLERHQEWVEVLKASGDAAALGQMITAAAVIPTAAIGGIYTLAQRLGSHWWLGVLAAGAGVWKLSHRLSPETRQTIKAGAAQVAAGYLYAYLRHVQAFEQFRRETAPVPAWQHLAVDCDPQMVLARACLYTLARAPASHRSASQLAKALPAIGVPQREQLVRESLRRHGCFDQPYRGRWQAGHPTQLPEPPLLVSSAAGQVVASAKDRQALHRILSIDG
jgi:hypothetical protein